MKCVSVALKHETPETPEMCHVLPGCPNSSMHMKLPFFHKYIYTPSFLNIDLVLLCFVMYQHMVFIPTLHVST